MTDASPEVLIEGMRAFHVTGALKAAIELDLFSHIAAGANTAPALAARCGAAERGVRILADFLTIRGFLDKPDGVWRLTPSSAAFLDRAASGYLGDAILFLAAPDRIADALRDPAATVRRGGAEAGASVAPDHPMWVTFARVMAPFARPMARALAADVAAWPDPPASVLDIAAGHGLYGIELALALPGARLTALDWAPVLAVAAENAACHGVADRYHTMAGSAFVIDWGRHDLILLPNFLHHFGFTDCVRLLARARRAGGRVLAVDYMPNPDRVSPPRAASFSFQMLIGTPEGDAYTHAELDGMAREAGFAGIAATPLGATAQTVVEFVRKANNCGQPHQSPNS